VFGKQRVKCTAGNISSFGTSAAPRHGLPASLLRLRVEPEPLSPEPVVMFDVGYGHTLISRNIHKSQSHAIVIGLTGGIATGKSTVSKQLVARGIPVIDADILARDVVRPGTRTLNKIVSTFGPDVLKEDGTLDRPKLGSIVFQDEEQRRKLNAIIHPAVRWAMALSILKFWLRGERVCVLDVPLLIETKIYQWVGRVVVVYWFASLDPAYSQCR